MKELVHRIRFTRIRIRYALAAAIVLSLALAASYQPYPTHASFPQGNDDGRVSRTVNGNTETWRIDEPNVRKKMTEYPQISFRTNDQVTITAGGCVQTGGHGQTWKRYVDPLGPNSDTFYHGMVLVPGAIGKLPASLDNAARILIVKGHPFTVGVLTEPRTAHLWLGYEDDNYSDNGYWGQDEGTQGQCKIGNSFVEHAFVIVTIVHRAAPAPQYLPYDLVPDQLDDNLILLNPKWGSQTYSPNFPPPDPSMCGGFAPFSSHCTSEPTTADNGTICNATGYDGHHNWAAGTYAGPIFWESHSSSIEDDDYNIRLVPPNGAGVTAAAGRAPTGELSLLLEFDSDETIDHFNTPWWNDFHTAVDTSDEAARQMINQREAIVTGLVGLDCAHSCSPEVHPVWAMAIKVNDDPADEQWAIFVRRFGDEGFCSDEQHYLDELAGDKFTFRLKWRPGATSLTVADSTVFRSKLGQAVGPEVVWAVNQGVLVSFTMPVPQFGEGELMDGVLHLAWTMGGNIRPPGPFPPRPFPVGPRLGISSGAVINFPQQGREQSEVAFEQLLGRMTPAQRQLYDSKISPKTVTRDTAPVRPAGPPRQVSSLLPGPGRFAKPKVRDVPDAEKKALEQQRIDGLHAVFGNNIPGFRPDRVVPTRRLP